jgi:nucleoside-diphosphate kinase
MSRTLCIFKPDLTADRRATAQALLRLLALDFVPTTLAFVQLTKAQATQLYAEHEGRPYFARNIEFMTSGPSMVMVLDGEYAVERLRDVAGTTDPKTARPGTLRRLYGAGLPNNAIHATATEAEVEDEIKIFFDLEEVI